MQLDWLTIICEAFDLLCRALYIKLAYFLLDHLCKLIKSLFAQSCDRRKEKNSKKTTDIFGKNSMDYEYFLKKLKDKDKDMYNKKILDMRKKNGNVSQFSNWRKPIADNHSIKDIDTAQALAFLQNNLQAMNCIVEEELHGGDWEWNNLQSCVPFKKDMPEEDRIDDEEPPYGTNGFSGTFYKIPTICAMSLNKTLTGRSCIFYIDTGFYTIYTLEDVRNAIFANQPLRIEPIKNATKNCLAHIREITLIGDKNYTKNKSYGLINNPNVRRETSTSTFAASSDIAALIQKYIRMTLEGFILEHGDEGEECTLIVYLPNAIHSYLESIKCGTNYGTNADKDIMSYVSTNNKWTNHTKLPIRFKQLPKCCTKQEHTTDRMVISINDRDTIEMVMPMSPHIVEVERTRWQQRDLSFAVKIGYKISHLDIKKSGNGLIYYVDGI